MPYAFFKAVEDTVREALGGWAPFRRPPRRGPACVVEGAVPVARVHELEQRLPGLTRGEGEPETAFDHHVPVTRGPVPVRPRAGPGPLDREEYLLHVTRRTGD